MTFECHGEIQYNKRAWNWKDINQNSSGGWSKCHSREQKKKLGPRCHKSFDFVPTFMKDTNSSLTGKHLYIKSNIAKNVSIGVIHMLKSIRKPICFLFIYFFIIIVH